MLLVFELKPFRFAPFSDSYADALFHRRLPECIVVRLAERIAVASLLDLVDAAASDFGVASSPPCELEPALFEPQRAAWLPAWHSGALPRLGLSERLAPVPGGHPAGLQFTEWRIAHVTWRVRLSCDLTVGARPPAGAARLRISRILAFRVTVLARIIRVLSASSTLTIPAGSGRRSRFRPGDSTAMPVRRYLMARGAAACA